MFNNKDFYDIDYLYIHVIRLLFDQPILPPEIYKN